MVRFRCIRSNGNVSKRHETANGNTGYPSCFWIGFRCFCHVSVYGFLEFRPALLRKLKQYGLSRRNLNGQKVQVADVRKRIEEIVSGPGTAGGYRSVCHTLQLEGLRVPRIIVQHLLQEIDPEGVSARKAHRLKRRVYSNPGPNYAWHLDGYDKLKPWGFPIHGCIDGFSRCILWLKVACSNNLPENPGRYYVETIAELGGVPVELVTDLGTENVLVADKITMLIGMCPPQGIKGLKDGGVSLVRIGHQSGEVFSRLGNPRYN